MSGKKNISAASIIGKTVTREKWLSIGIVLTVTGAVAISLLPPLVLGKIIDRIAGGNFSGFSMAAEYFLLIFLTGALESLRESFLTVFGQKMTHAFRSELSDKLVRLSADTLNKEEPGAVVSSAVYLRDHQHVRGCMQSRQHFCGDLVPEPRTRTALDRSDPGDLCVHEARTEADAHGAACKPCGGEPCHKPCSGDDPLYPDDPHAWKRDVHGETV